MTTDSKSQKKDTDAKNVFGPLGKYAIIAVIMVSIIVTTAIMLDKQLSSTDQEVAKIENNIAEITTAELAAAVTESSETAQSDVTTEVVEAASVTETVVETTVQTTVETAVETEVKAEVQAIVAETAKETAEQLPAVAAVEETAAIAAVSKTETVTETTTVTASPEVAEQTTPDMASIDTDSAIQTDHQQRSQAIKAIQKQRLAEMFTRIEALEAQRLDQYKARQDKQIERLRSQIAQQQQMIDELITRNKNRLDMRAAKVQQQQSSRKDMLNRI